jgi:hypothetical protein
MLIGFSRDPQCGSWPGVGKLLQAVALQRGEISNDRAGKKLAHPRDFVCLCAFISQAEEGSHEERKEGMRIHLGFKVLTAVFPLLLMLSLAITEPAFADNLNITGGVPGVACANSSVSSGALTFSCPPSPLTGVLTSSGSGNLSSGVFGVSTEVSGVSFTTGGSTSADLFVTYDFAVSGVTNGTARFPISVPGVLSCTGCINGLGLATSTFFDGSGESINGGPLGLATSLALGNGNNNLVVGIPVSNGVAQLFFSIQISAGCAGGPTFNGPACTAIADFLDPLSITGASVFDSTGNLVSGATLVSDSGFNPNSGIGPVATPEPSSVVLMLTGIGFLLVMPKRLSPVPDAP